MDVDKGGTCILWGGVGWGGEGGGAGIHSLLLKITVYTSLNCHRFTFSENIMTCILILKNICGIFGLLDF